MTPGDDYITPNPTPNVVTTFSGAGLPSGPYSIASLPLVVSGPHIIATNVTGIAGTTTGASTDHLVVNDQANTVAVTYDRNVQVASVTSSQILSVIGPAGPISGPQTFNSSGLSQLYTSTSNIGKVIPAGTTTTTNGVATFNPGMLVSTLPILNTGLTISSLKVTINITDPDDNDLTINLISPSGKVIPLVQNPTSTGANFTNTTFSDIAPANGALPAAASGTAPFSGTYSPASPLSVLSGTSLDGNWQLQILNSSRDA